MELYVDGRLVMRAGDPDGRPFLISTRSEEDQRSSMGRTATLLTLAAAVAGGLAAILLVAAAVTSGGR